MSQSKDSHFSADLLTSMWFRNCLDGLCFQISMCIFRTSQLAPHENFSRGLQTQLITSQLINFSCVEGTAASWFILWIGIDSLCFLFSASSSQLLDLRLSFSTVFCSPGTFLAAQVFAIAQPHTHLPKDYNSSMPVYILTTGRTGHPATIEIATSPTGTIPALLQAAPPFLGIGSELLVGPFSSVASFLHSTEHSGVDT